MALMRVARTAAQVLCVAFALLSGATLVVFGIGPRVFHYQTVTVLTGSMRPSRPPGSVLIETLVPTSRVKVGDVITYNTRDPERPIVTHRVVEVLHRGRVTTVQTQGDANADRDPWIVSLTAPTTWRARATLRGVGFVINRLRQPIVGRVLVLIVPSVIAIAWLKEIWHDDGDSDAVVPSLPVAVTDLRPRRATLRGAVALTMLLGAGYATTFAVRSVSARRWR